MQPMPSNGDAVSVDSDKGAVQEIARHLRHGQSAPRVAIIHYWLVGMRGKAGLITQHDNDKELIDALFDVMAAGKADFTLTFYNMSRLDIEPTEQDRDLHALFDDPEQIDQWVRQWRARLHDEGSIDTTRQAGMRAVNPVYIPRNHLVEAAIRSAEDNNDFSVFLDLHAVLQRPFERQPEMDAYMLPPEPHEVVEQTFCGT